MERFHCLLGMRMQIELLREEDVPHACGLFEHVFGHHVSPDYWRWKYHGSHLLGCVNVIAKDTEGNLIGHAGAMVLPGSAKDGQSCPVAQVCDIMVAQAVRGGLGRDGIYPILIRTLQSALADKFPGIYAYGFPGERPFRLGERLGFYWRIRDIKEYRLQAALRDHFSLWSVKSMNWNSPHINRLESLSVTLRSAPAALRNSAYLEWRYRDCPHRAYVLLGVHRAFRTVGWAVVAREGDALRIVDACLPGRPPSALVKAILEWAASQGFREVVTWLETPGIQGADTGIVATEFAVFPPLGRFRPHFQPGDIDIF